MLLTDGQCGSVIRDDDDSALCCCQVDNVVQLNGTIMILHSVVDRWTMWFSYTRR